MTIGILRKIRDDKGYLEFKFPDIDYTKTPEEIEQEITSYGGELHGTVIDMQTANVLVTVHDALGSKHQTKFQKMLVCWKGFEKLVNFSWKQVK